MSHLSRSRSLMTLVATVVVVASAPVGAGPSSPGARADAGVDSHTASALVVERSIGYIAYWDQPRALQSIEVAGPALTEVSPSWYAPAADGSIVVQQDGAVDDSPSVVRQLRAHGALVVPALANYRDKSWDPTVVADILSGPAQRQEHVDRIRALVRDRGFDGIDIDYEHLTAADRAPFTAFVTALAEALHADGKLLSVTLHPKTSEPGPQPKNQAQNYAAIGRVADEVRIMLYDYHWDTSPPGALAPIAWVRSVMTWAATQVPRHKLVLGVATYGYDWVGSRGTSLMWNEIRNRADAHDATVHYNRKKQAPWFAYVDKRGRNHTVWFENARSLAAKQSVMRDIGASGMHYWRLGGEDPAIW
ncbi:MAG: glycosyl hydrolase family 18 protein [Actinomycetota bacterium]|nr:glycosyl hydrolase family 18 protein [Actinomycetota bacterium]